MLCEEPVIPCRIFGESVIRDHEGFDLSLGQVIEADGKNLAPAEQLGS
jgi:hypothetical protein